MSEILLEMKNINKEFPGVKALDNVSLKVRKGTVHALMGENGAGKSTLMKCLFGIYSKDSGQIFLDGNEVSFKNSDDALKNGVAMVHQELNQALKRNVMDNIWLGRYPTLMNFIVNERKMYQDTKEIFEMLNINVDPKEIMSNMPVAQRQMVEIATACPLLDFHVYSRIVNTLFHCLFYTPFESPNFGPTARNGMKGVGQMTFSYIRSTHIT